MSASPINDLLDDLIQHDPPAFDAMVEYTAAGSLAPAFAAELEADYPDPFAMLRLLQFFERRADVVAGAKAATKAMKVSNRRLIEMVDRELDEALASDDPQELTDWLGYWDDAVHDVFDTWNSYEREDYGRDINLAPTRRRGVAAIVNTVTPPTLDELLAVMETW